MNKIIKNTANLLKVTACTLAFSALAAAPCVPVLAGVSVEYSTEEGTHLFPDRIILTDVSTLGEESLPENSYGKLVFSDPDAGISAGELGAEVKLIPSDGQDLSWASGYDAQENVVRRQVQVVVVYSDGDGAEEVKAAEDAERSSEEEQDAAEPAAQSTSADQDTQDTAVPDGKASEEQIAQADAEPSEEQSTAAGDEPAEAASGPEAASDQDEASLSGQNAESPADGTANETLVDVESFDAAMKAAAEEAAAAIAAAAQTSDGQGSAAEQAPADQPAASDMGGAPGEDAQAAADVPSEPVKTIFDSYTEEDTRSTEYGQDLTEEQKLEAAAANHTSNGIFVSGTNLPWYVQFTAKNEDYREFASAGTANIFASFRFELKDLSTGSDYEIPDGEYVSVNVPVKEGYNYTVEHILDNGGVELITPALTGSILSFSTHSFSSFGIAGSRPVVDSLAEDTYNTVTPAPTSTPLPSSQGSTSQSRNTGNAGTSAGNTTSGNATTGNSNNGTGTPAGNNAGYSNSAQTSAGTPTVNQTVTNNTDSNHFNVQTGDDTPILPLIGIVAAALVVIVLILILKRKRK